MLEELAIDLLRKDESTLTVIGAGVALLGFIIALVVRSKARVELQRSPYFVLSAVLYLAGSAINLLGLFVFQAMSLGILWTLVGGGLVGTAILGFCLGVIASARSRDAFGSGGSAILAFIPIANFIPIFKGSKNAVSSNRVVPMQLFTGGKGVSVGIALLIAGAGISVWIESRSNDMTESPTYEAIYTDALLRAKGIEETLRILAAANDLPIKIGDFTTLILLQADRNYLRRTFVIERGEMVMSDLFRSRIEDFVCGDWSLGILLRGGANVEEIYLNADGSTIGRHTVTRENCGY